MITPLCPREFFSRPWVGTGELKLSIGVTSRFGFRSECDFRSDTEWTVRDTTSFEGRAPAVREMHARLVAPDRIQTTADDMPGGATVTLEERGFRFEPYVLKVPVGPLRVRMRFHDRCWLDAEDTLHDEIYVRFLGFPIGRIEIKLVRAAILARE